MCDINTIELTCHGVKKLRFERCSDKFPKSFEPMVETELSEKGMQQERFRINPSTGGNEVKFVKLTILSGLQQFAAVHAVAMEGTVHNYQHDN